MIIYDFYGNNNNIKNGNNNNNNNTDNINDDIDMKKPSLNSINIKKIEMDTNIGNIVFDNTNNKNNNINNNQNKNINTTNNSDDIIINKSILNIVNRFGYKVKNDIEYYKNEFVKLISGILIKLDELYTDHDYVNIIDKYHINKEDRIRILALRNNDANSWLNCIPNNYME